MLIICYSHLVMSYDDIVQSAGYPTSEVWMLRADLVSF